MSRLLGPMHAETIPQTVNMGVKSNGNGNLAGAGTGKSGEQFCNEFEKPETVIFIKIFRAVCLAIWSSAIVYATYQLYLTCERELHWQKDPVLNPGPFAKFLGRGRDTSDYEWQMLIRLLSTQLIFWYAAYVILQIVAQKCNFHPKLTRLLSPLMTCLLLRCVVGSKATIFLIAQPLLFYVLMHKTRSKAVIWAVVLTLLTFINSPVYRSFASDTETADYFFTIVAAWSYSRCLSFCFDTWDRNVQSWGHGKAVFSMLSYCFYFPLVLTGPIVLYSQFEKEILGKQTAATMKTVTPEKLKTLLKGFARMGFWILVCELTLHYIYFRPLSLTLPVLHHINLWALCGTVFWLGQFFMMKYVVMYGVSSCLAEFDGLSMPPLPRCIAYIHRYSVIWKDFDRGLYDFLIRYTYVPTLQAIKDYDKGNKISSELRKLIASFATYTYVWIWHSVSFDILVWAGLNFLGITIDRVGSFLKRKIERRVDKPIHPMFWDFIVEPIVTIPLAVMSILNSVVFCGNLRAAIIFTGRMWTDWNHNYIFHFMYIFTHVAVAARSWMWSHRKESVKAVNNQAKVN